MTHYNCGDRQGVTRVWRETGKKNINALRIQYYNGSRMLLGLPRRILDVY